MSLEGHVFNDCSNLESVLLFKDVTEIQYAAFNNCKNLKDVYYTGSEDDWNAMQIGDYNDALLNATIHYNWDPNDPIPTQPQQPAYQQQQPQPAQQQNYQQAYQQPYGYQQQTPYTNNPMK